MLELRKKYGTSLFNISAGYPDMLKQTSKTVRNGCQTSHDFLHDKMHSHSASKNNFPPSTEPEVRHSVHRSTHWPL